ncbi:hypothetical protein GW17_00019822 [Ensete ventricosum]|nr:hypothetical protein GW17_00019822 [Ensete ventricosum]
MDPSYPVAGVGCWNGGVRVRRRHLRSGREPTPAKRLGRVSSRRDPSDDQVSLVVDFSIPLPRRGAGAYIVGVVGHPYLTTLLPLWLTMPSYTSTTPAVLATKGNKTGVSAAVAKQEGGSGKGKRLERQQHGEEDGDWSVRGGDCSDSGRGGRRRLQRGINDHFERIWPPRSLRGICLLDLYRGSTILGCPLNFDFN